MKCVVTGGGGFVGSALCKNLRRSGHEVVAIARGAYPALESLGVTFARLDLGADDGSALVRACEGASVVFHVASKVDMWGRYEDFYRTNVLGTRNVLAACRRAAVPLLVYTSSPSVIADGTDHRGVDESTPYPSKYRSFYPMTKAIAEREVLMAHGREGLSTIALRPHLIWGPGDTHLVPTILARAKAGRLPQIGDGSNEVDLSFIEDCVAAHIAAMDALAHNTDVGGRPYFISQGEPVKMWEWIAEVLRRSKVTPITRKVSYPVAMAVAWCAEAIARAVPATGEPILTRFLVSQMATSHYFSIEAARNNLGYRPAYSIKAALDKTFGAA